MNTQTIVPSRIDWDNLNQMVSGSEDTPDQDFAFADGVNVTSATDVTEAEPHYLLGCMSLSDMIG